MGCGIACVALLTNKSYEYVKNNYFYKLPGDAKTYGYSGKSISKALKKAGYYYYNRREVLRGRDFGKIPNNSICFVRRKPEDKYYHYIIKAAGYWSDPANNKKHISLPKRYQIVSFIKPIDLPKT